MSSDYANEKISDEPAIVSAQQSAAAWFPLVSVALAMIGCVTLAAMLLILLWGANRGIEFRDDGLAMLCMANPFNYSQPEAFGHFLRLCPHLVQNDIINLRLWHIISSLIGGSVLAWGFTRWAAGHWPELLADRWSTWGIWLVAAIGSLMAFSVLSPALSYNGIASLFIFSAAGCLFYAISEPAPAARSNTAFAVCGALAALGFFAKFCAAILFIALAALIVLVVRPRAIASAVSWCLIGSVCGALLFFAFVQAPQDWWRSFSGAMSLELSGAHGPGVIFGATGESLFKHLTEIAVSFCAIGIAFFDLVLAKSSRLAAHKSLVIWSTLLLASVGFAVLSIFEIGYAHTSLLYVPVLPIAVASLFMIGKSTLWQSGNHTKPRPALCVVSSLMLLSVATAAGSNNVLGWEMVDYFAPVTIFYWVAYFAIARFLGSRAFFFVSVTMLLATCFAVFFQGYVIAPHGTDSLLEQTETATWPKRIEGLKLSKGDLAFIQETDRTLRSAGFHDENRLIALYDLPMLVYAVNAVSAGGAWYYADPRDVPKNEYYLETARHENGPLYLIVYIIDDRSPDVQQFLHRHGFDLEHDFQQIGTTERERWGNIAKIYKFRRNPETR